MGCNMSVCHLLTQWNILWLTTKYLRPSSLRGPHKWLIQERHINTTLNISINHYGHGTFRSGAQGSPKSRDRLGSWFSTIPFPYFLSVTVMPCFWASLLLSKDLQAHLKRTNVVE